MYNQKIIDRLNNLTYLKALKNSNATAITKKNPYGDIVKFYAQINKNDVIQAITFKCTGCSYFTALCSYFCELAEGKTVAEALKIKEKELVAFAKLDESRHHIYPLILGTFALLVKKYRKAIELGKVEPCEVVESINVVEKKTVSKKKSMDTTGGLKDILVNNSASTSRQRKSTTVTTEVTETINQEIRVSKTETVSTSKRKTEKEDRVARAKAIARAVEMEAKVESEKKGKEASNKSVKADKKLAISKEKPVKESKKEKAEEVKLEVAPKKEKEPKQKVEKVSKSETKKASKTTATKVTKTVEVVEEKTSKKVAKKSGLFGRKQKTEEAKTSNVIIDENTGLRKKSVDLAIINESHDEHYEESKNHDEAIILSDEKSVTPSGDVIVSNTIPNDTSDTTQVIVQTVEQKRSVKTTVKNGETTTVAGEQINAMKLSAEGEDAHKQIHSASSLSDMISKLNSSKSKVNSVEAHSVTRVEKSVNGKPVDSASTLSSFSSMRDSLHRIRENGVGAGSIEQKKALPVAEKKTTEKKTSLASSKGKTKEDENIFVERTPKSKDIAKEVREKEEKGSKKGLFGWLFKK